MPTYEYRCDACGHRFERLQSFSDDPVRTCPECGEDAVERLISAGAGLVFKGSGFYETDYRKKERPGPGPEGEGGASGGDGDGAGDGEGTTSDAGSTGSAAPDREASGGE